MESISAIKTVEELDCIRKAVDITDKAFHHILAAIKPGKTTEKELAADITYFQMKLGGEKNSFDPVVHQIQVTGNIEMSDHPLQEHPN